jgi:hypothetical protein
MNVNGVAALTRVSGSTGTVSAAQAKQIGLAFEQMLVNELAQQLAATAGDPGDSSSDGSVGGIGGLMGSDPASTAYSQLIPGALTSSIMSSGGTGIAQEIAASLDPALSEGPKA